MQNKNNTAFLFSGQGSQYIGMAKDLYDEFAEAREIFKTADEILGYSLEKIVFGDDEALLAKTIHSQPAIMATSLCAFAVAKSRGIEFGAVAGHSLGEYSAMVAGGVVTIEDGFRLIKARAEAMQKASELSSGAMCAVIGLDASEVEAVCAQIDGYVVPVNYNSTVQTVIAGETDAVDLAIAKFGEKKARCMKLGVSSAFHSKLMQPASDEFIKAAEKISFSKPSVSFFSNVLGTELEDFTNMPSLLASHIVSPVKFTSELAELWGRGFTNFVELGPNKVLTGLVKKTLKEAVAVNIDSIKTLEKALESLNA